MKRSEDVSQIIPAMVRLLSKMEDVRKGRKAKIATKTGPGYEYSYADLKDVLAYSRPLLASHGLALTQEAHSDERGTSVTTHIFHDSGQWLEYEALRLPAGSDAQSHGSAITFARRYTAMSALGMATEDDDGAKAKPAPPKTKPSDAAMNLYAAVCRVKGTPVAADLKGEAENNHRQLTAVAFDADPEWAKLVDHILTQYALSDEPTA